MTTTELYGVMLCHGYNHTPWQIKFPQIPDHVRWILVDGDPHAGADIMINFHDTDKMISTFGMRSQDYVVSAGCPIFDVNKMLYSVNAVLKEGGEFLLISGIKLFISALNVTTLRMNAGLSLDNVNDPVAHARFTDLFNFIWRLGVYPPQFLPLTIPERQLYSLYHYQDPILMKYINEVANAMAYVGRFSSWSIAPGSLDVHFFV